MYHTIGKLKKKLKLSNLNESTDCLIDNSISNEQINSDEKFLTNFNNLIIEEKKINNKNCLLKKKCNFEYLLVPLRWMDLSSYQDKVNYFK